MIAFMDRSSMRWGLGRWMSLAMSTRPSAMVDPQLTLFREIASEIPMLAIPTIPGLNMCKNSWNSPIAQAIPAISGTALLSAATVSVGVYFVFDTFHWRKKLVYGSWMKSIAITAMMATMHQRHPVMSLSLMVACERINAPS